MPAHLTTKLSASQQPGDALKVLNDFWTPRGVPEVLPKALSTSAPLLSMDRSCHWDLLGRIWKSIRWSGVHILFSGRAWKCWCWKNNKSDTLPYNCINTSRSGWGPVRLNFYGVTQAAWLTTTARVTNKDRGYLARKSQSCSLAPVPVLPPPSWRSPEGLFSKGCFWGGVGWLCEWAEL